MDSDRLMAIFTPLGRLRRLKRWRVLSNKVLFLGRDTPAWLRLHFHSYSQEADAALNDRKAQTDTGILDSDSQSGGLTVTTNLYLA